MHQECAEYFERPVTDASDTTDVCNDTAHRRT